MSEVDAVAFLSEEWDDEHVGRLACWGRCSSTPPTSDNQPLCLQLLVSDRTNPFLTRMGHWTLRAPLALAQSPDRDANLARNADQATAGIQISDDIPRPSDNLPTLANIVTAAMSNRSYIPLFYLTVEGRHAADREGLNSTNPLDGFKASHSQLKSPSSRSRLIHLRDS